MMVNPAEIKAQSNAAPTPVRMDPAPVKADNPPTPQPVAAVSNEPRKTVDVSATADYVAEVSEKMLEQIKDSIEELNAHLDKTQRALSFSMDEVTNRPVVSVMNRETGEMLRQIPGEVFLRVAHHIERLKGLIFDERI
jgi:flagellar protein FlaG